MAFKRTLCTIKQLEYCVEILQRNISTIKCNNINGKVVKNELKKFAQIQSRTFSVLSNSNSCQIKCHNSISNANPNFMSASLLEKQSVTTCTSSSRPTQGQGYCTESGDGAEKTNARTDVLYDELLDLINEGKTLLVDVREPKEIGETGMMPGAINIPITKLKNSMNIEENDFIDAYKKPRPSGLGERLVFYGLSNVKSESALELAHKAGFKKARHYPGGWREWAEKQNEK